MSISILHFYREKRTSLRWSQGASKNLYIPRMPLNSVSERDNLLDLVRVARVTRNCLYRDKGELGLHDQSILIRGTSTDAMARIRKRDWE
jgi:hypothetical protein